MNNPSALMWLRRRVGSWRSERRYMFKADGDPKNYTTNFVVSHGERGNEFVVDWKGATEGTMPLVLEGDILGRGRDYFGDDAHDSKIEMIDQDTMVLHTSYGGMNYREEIRLINHDEFALRQTIGFKDDGTFGLVGQYAEFRMP